MKKYQIIYLLKKKTLCVFIKSDIFINAYQTFIESYSYNEILSIIKI